MQLKDYIEDNAKTLKGNWQNFECFAWHNKPDDAEEFCIVYTHHRDSGLLELSNAQTIEKEMENFDSDDCFTFCANHWAVGHVDGYAIRVYKKGTEEPTEAFAKYCELQMQLEDYPVLDESHYSQMEYEATLDNIKDKLAFFDLPNDSDIDELASQLFSWFWENDQSAVEDVDGHGGYPSRKQIEAALNALGIKHE